LKPELGEITGTRAGILAAPPDDSSGSDDADRYHHHRDVHEFTSFRRVRVRIASLA
jgi:hypothetical protein